MRQLEFSKPTPWLTLTTAKSYCAVQVTFEACQPDTSMPTMSAMAIAGVHASSTANSAAMRACSGLLLFLNLPIRFPSYVVGMKIAPAGLGEG